MTAARVIARWLGLILVLLYIGSALAGPVDEYDRAKEAYKRFDSDPKAVKYRDRWMRVIDGFAKIAEKYPKHTKGCDARYNVAMLYERLAQVSYLKDDRLRAAKEYELLAQRCPNHRLADDGYYNAAMIRVQLGEKSKARALLNTELKKEPKGDTIGLAKQLLASLNQELGPEPSTQPTSQAAPQAQAQPEAAEMNRLTNLVAFSRKGQTELRILFEDTPQFTTGEAPATDTKPKRMYFDFPQARMGQGIQSVYSFDSPHISQIRVGHYDDNTTRVVVDFKDKHLPFDLGVSNEPPMMMVHFGKKAPQAEAVAATVDEEGEDDSAAVVAVAPVVTPKDSNAQSEATPATSPDQAPANQESKPAAAQNQDAQLGIEDLIAQTSGQATQKEKAKPKRKPAAKKPTKPTPKPSGKVDRYYQVRKVVIDAGHGGRDYGATGPTGAKEKEVVLAITKKVARKLRKRLKVKTVLTRTDDTYLGLKERSDKANKEGADLFISIHANASRKRKITGIETYYLNNSSDSYSRRLAARENRDLGKKVDDLQFILTDLSMNVNISDSIVLARFVQNAMIKRLKKRYSGIKDRGVGRALFFVLLNVRMPAILVETSFISNSQEEKRLKSSAYQDRVAEAIVDGVAQYVDYMNKLAKKRKP